MKWCYNNLVIFIFTLLLNNAKPNSLRQIQRTSSSQSLETRKYAFNPIFSTGNNVVLINQPKPLSVGWSRIATTVETSQGKVLEHLIEYELSLQSPLDLFSNEDSSIIDVYKSRKQIVKEKDFTFCDPGPCYDHKLFTITINQKLNTFDIKPSLDALRQILINFAPINPEIQSVANMILNANLPEDQFSLGKKIIAMIHEHLAIDMENVDVEDNLVKYVDTNGEYCFKKLATTLQPVPCPMDTTSIPLYNLDPDNMVIVKYIDSNGKEHCFDMNDYEIRPTTCPLDTSLLPEITIKKYLDANNREYCSAINGITTIHFACPQSLSSLPVTSTEILQNAGKGRGQILSPYGSYLGGSSLPLDTNYGSQGRGYYSDQNLVKYVDANGEHCFRKLGSTLQAVPCPLDTSLIPLHELNSDNKLTVKYTDSNGRVHCFDQSDNEIRPTTCPLDTSLLPEIAIKKYLDDNNREYCSALNGITTIRFACPKSLSSLPLTSTEILQNAGKGRGQILSPYGRNPGGSGLPLDTIYGSQGKGYYPDQNLVKYVDANGEHCFRKLGSTLQAVPCPLDTSLIPLHELNSDNKLTVKYTDSNGRVHCFDQSDYEIRPTTCPLDTSLLPEIDIKKYLDANNREYCSAINGITTIHFTCPQSLSSLPVTSTEILQNAGKGRGQILSPYGSYLGGSSLPLDTIYGSQGRGYYSDQNLVKYVDANGEHCFRKLGSTLQAVPCPLDTSLIPLYELNSDNKLTVKYTDSNGRVHCFDQSDYEIRPTTCPLDTSLLPEIAIKKYLDDNNREYCSALNGITALHFACPQSLSSLPLTSTEILQNAGKGRGQILSPYGRNPGGSNLPLDTIYGSQGRGYYPDSNLVKYVDANGEHCHRKLGSTLQAVPCPLDTSLIPLYKLNSDNTLTVKYTDADGRVNCFDMSDYEIRPITCPSDTSLLPEIAIKKYLDDNNREYCSAINGITTIHFGCPQSLSSLPLTSTKILKNAGKGRGQILSPYGMNPGGSGLPLDTIYGSQGRGYYPDQNLVKYVDANGEHCFRKLGSTLQAVPCPLDTSLIPLYELNSDNKLTVKYTDSNGRVHCFDQSDYEIRPTTCPSDTSLLPEIAIKKYLDDNNREYCSALNGITAIHFACPQSLSSLPLTSTEIVQNAGKGRGQILSPYGRNPGGSNLPLDTIYGSQGRGYYPDQNLVKYVDANGEHCFRKLGSTLQAVPCPLDTSLIPLHELNSDNTLTVKYTDSNGRVHCFDQSEYEGRIRPTTCPSDTSLLPEIAIKKYLDDNNREYCSAINGFTTIHFACPQSLSSLPLTSTEILQNAGKGRGQILSPYGRNPGGSSSPLDTIYGSQGRGYYPDPNLVKYVDANGEHCFRKLGSNLQAVPCPLDTSLIPLYKLNSDNTLTVKYIDSNGRVHCFDMNDYEIRPKTCPLDTSLLPEIAIKKYLDGKNNEYCSVLTGVSTMRFDCPKSLPFIPTTIDNFQEDIVKNTDMQGRVRCYRKTANNFNSITCPRDTSRLPEVNLDFGPEFSPTSYGRDFGVSRQPYGMNMGYGRGPLMDILSKLNKGRGLVNFAPDGSGEINVSYNDLMALSKLLCTKNQY